VQSHRIEVQAYESTGAHLHRFLQMLRPGGRLLISDYCRKAGDVSSEFKKYIKQRGYDLHGCGAVRSSFHDIDVEVLG